MTSVSLPKTKMRSLLFPLWGSRTVPSWVSTWLPTFCLAVCPQARISEVSALSLAKRGGEHSGTVRTEFHIWRQSLPGRPETAFQCCPSVVALFLKPIPLWQAPRCLTVSLTGELCSGRGHIPTHDHVIGAQYVFLELMKQCPLSILGSPPPPPPPRAARVKYTCFHT